MNKRDLDYMHADRLILKAYRFDLRKRAVIVPKRVMQAIVRQLVRVMDETPIPTSR